MIGLVSPPLQQADADGLDLFSPSDHPSRRAPGRYRRSGPIIDEAADAAGRDPREIRTIFNFPGRITDRPLEIVPAVREAIEKARLG